MKTYSSTLGNGESITYVDQKRPWWSLSVLFPLQPLLGIFLHATTGNEGWLLLPFAINYVLLPLVDHIVGEDRNNPPPAVVKDLEADRYYRSLTFIVVPLHFISLVLAAWWAGTQDLATWAFIGLAVIAGTTSGLGINTGHELGHKKPKFERILARIVLAVPVYGHFTLEHNRGHHRDVSTPEDPASSRMGENIYRFACREIPGAFRRAWQIEHERLKRQGHATWSSHNEILQSWALSAVVQVGLILWLGWSMLLFLCVHNFFAWWQLTSANYVEHYGLLRSRTVDGKYERCQPHHSWNSNHIVSNLVLFHLQRHSDHHAHPLRRYQSLRHFEHLPTLPNGYFGVYLLAYVPWLWFRVMDPKLINLPHINGDANKLNIDPRAMDSIRRKFPVLELPSTGNV